MIAVDDIGLSESGRRKFPWKVTPVGKSFFVDGGDYPSAIRSRLNSGATYYWGSGNFAIRKERDGFRVYRTSER